jgi:hypothetical protein
MHIIVVNYAFKVPFISLKNSFKSVKFQPKSYPLPLSEKIH